MLWAPSALTRTYAADIRPLSPHATPCGQGWYAPDRASGLAMVPGGILSACLCVCVRVKHDPLSMTLEHDVETW